MVITLLHHQWFLEFIDSLLDGIGHTALQLRQVAMEIALLIRLDSLPHDLCWSGVEKGEVLDKGCRICVMPVCDPDFRCNHGKNLR